jgi:hypothetical protein
MIGHGMVPRQIKAESYGIELLTRWLGDFKFVLTCCEGACNHVQTMITYQINIRALYIRTAYATISGPFMA